MGERITSRLRVLSISQSELARRVGLTQPAINALVRGASRSTAHLYKIARALETTPEYLLGETDDPDLNAPPSLPPIPTRIMMEIVLPPEGALAEMFAALLDGIDPAASLDERALLLARRLPIGLSQLQNLRRAQTPDPVPRPALAGEDAYPAMLHHEQRS
jgi:transcriptional regulator with XRE-family HTH domain